MIFCDVRIYKIAGLAAWRWSFRKICFGFLKFACTHSSYRTRLFHIFMDVDNRMGGFRETKDIYILQFPDGFILCSVFKFLGFHNVSQISLTRRFLKIKSSINDIEKHVWTENLKLFLNVQCVESSFVGVHFVTAGLLFYTFSLKLKHTNGYYVRFLPQCMIV